MNNLGVEQTKAMILHIVADIQSRKEELGEIDRLIGDGDHGIGMSIGCAEIEKILSEKKYENIGDIFKDSGMAMIRSMGGASGIIFGSLFLGFSKPLNGDTELNLQNFAEGAQIAVEKIKKRGGASLGDKTMIDALEPAADALLKAANEGADFNIGVSKAVQEAATGVENTKKYIAKYGRAKSLGERAIGYQDAGATSVYYIFRAIEAFCQKEVSQEVAHEF